MSAQTNLQKDILVLNLEEQLKEVAKEMFGKELAALTDQETYYAVLVLTKRLMAVSDSNEGEKKIYYISAEFLIGKLLSNNLINLGVYDKMSEILEKNGKKLSVIEEIEPEPSLGNGGLGRLAACFLDSIATLGFPGEGIGLNYHFGLFKQVFKDKLQTAEKNEWIEENSWLTKTDITYDVYFGKKKVTSRLYDIDVAGYDSGVNKLFSAPDICVALVASNTLKVETTASFAVIPVTNAVEIRQSEKPSGPNIGAIHCPSIARRLSALFVTTFRRVSKV